MELFNIKFVGAVEQRPELYDYNRPEYSRRDLVEKAWIEISQEVNLPVNECKEKWRNLRSTFAKNVRPRGPRERSIKRKPYYLSDAMKFALPFIKVAGNSPDNPLDLPQFGNSSSPGKSDNQDDVVTVPRIIRRKKKADSTLQCQPDRAVANVPAKVAKITNPSRVEKSDGTPQSRGEKKDGIQQFLNSLIPDLMQLTDVQLRMYKRKVLLLIDEVSGTDPEIYRPSTNDAGPRGPLRSFQLASSEALLIDHNQSWQQPQPKSSPSGSDISERSQPSPCESVDLTDPICKEES